MGCTDDVARGRHRLEVIQDCGKGHPEVAGCFGRRQRALLEEQRVDGVFVRTQTGPLESVGQHVAQSLTGHEEVEQERNVSAVCHLCHCSWKYHGSVAFTTVPW